MTTDNAIYVIALEATREDNSGRDYTETIIDPDFGYFTTREDAESFVDRIDGPAKARYEVEKSEYEKKWEAHQKKDAEARRLGFVAPQFYAPRPWVPDYHTVIEVKKNA